jgi:para-nitrobenzyl esterase
MINMKKTEIIETLSGRIRGYIIDDLSIFKGIPYAARPIGDLRFAPPISDPWPGLLEAYDYGPECPQSIPPLLMNPPNPQSEADCLTLNIWTPSTDNEKRPVMVWIHGGGFTVGSGRLYDGSYLAKRGNVVIVTINYRLGALGFLIIPEITANVGLYDQIFALKWIQKNIQHFGGNPDNITLFGQSAGAMSISTLLALPEAKGLFHRIIAQSGACNPISFRTKEGLEITRKILAKLNIEDDNKDTLMKISAYELVRAATETEEYPPRIPWPITIPPYIDGTLVLDHPLKLISKSLGSNVDILIGTNRDESKLWNIYLPANKIANEDEMIKRISYSLKAIDHQGQMENLIQAYRKTREKNVQPQDILDAFNTDLEFRVPAIRLAESLLEHNSNVYMYLFDWPSPFWGGRFGACHTTEIPFVFGMLEDPHWSIWSGNGIEEKNLCEKVMDAWIAFAQTGEPNHVQIPQWSKYDLDHRKTMVIGNEFKVIEDPNQSERRAWKDIL